MKFVDYDENLKASKAEKQHLLQALELKQKMEHARDAQISKLKTTLELREKCKYQLKHTPFDLP